MIVIYWLFILLNYNDENFHFLFRPKTKFWSQNANFFAREEDRMMSVGSNFLCGRPCGADTPSPSVRMRPPEPDPPPVDVINGWPLNSLQTGVLLPRLRALLADITFDNTRFLICYCSGLRSNPSCITHTLGRKQVTLLTN